LASRLARSRKARLGTEFLCEWVYRPLAHVVVLALAPLRVPPPVVVLASAAAGLAAAVELARGIAPSWDSSVLGRLYGLLYGWQDLLVERFVERRLRRLGEEARAAYHDRATVAILANLGMTTQLAVFGLCIAVGHPLAFAGVALAEIGFVAAHLVRRGSFVTVDREVVLEHR
jgi:hypothetical protein